MKANDICSLLQTNYTNCNDDTSALIVKELHICNGRSIVDLAIINDSLNAFEIKSNADSLARLPAQIEHYNKVFDYITIVVGESHLEKVIKVVPGFWGIWSVVVSEVEVVTNVIRKESKNLDKDAFSIAQLLWKEEILDLLQRNNMHKGMAAKRKWLLWEFLAKSFTLHDLTNEVKYYLKSRGKWREEHSDDNSRRKIQYI